MKPCAREHEDGWWTLAAHSLGRIKPESICLNQVGPGRRTTVKRGCGTLTGPPQSVGLHSYKRCVCVCVYKCNTQPTTPLPRPRRLKKLGRCEQHDTDPKHTVKIAPVCKEGNSENSNLAKYVPWLVSNRKPLDYFTVKMLSNKSSPAKKHLKRIMCEEWQNISLQICEWKKKRAREKKTGICRGAKLTVVAGGS